MENYFTLDKQDCLIELNGEKARYSSRGYNCFGHKNDKIIRELVLEFRKRNFNMEGFDFDFVFEPETKEVKLFRAENKALNLRIVGENTIRIKGKEICVYDDGSGSLDLYCGKDWDKDKNEFCDGRKFHRKMDGFNRILLHYSLYRGKFDYDSDCGRGHDLESGDESAYSLGAINDQIYEEIEWILEMVKQQPVPVRIGNLFQEPEPIYLTNPLFKDSFFQGFCDADLSKIKDIKPGWRLLSLSTIPPEHLLSGIMTDGFIYLDIVNKDSGKLLQPKDTVYWNQRNLSTFIVTPKCYNNFYVLDASIFEDLKNKWFEENKECERMPMENVNEIYFEQAKSLVPINEYKGNYNKPVILVNRSIGVGELKELKNYKDFA